MTNQPTLKDYAIRMRTLVEGQMQYAADLRELAKEMRETGFQAAVLKAWVKAIISFDDGDEKPLEALKARTAEVALYGDILGFAVDGFGETNHFVVKESPQGDGDGGGDGPATSDIVACGFDSRLADLYPVTGMWERWKWPAAGIKPGPSPTIPEKAAPGCWNPPYVGASPSEDDAHGNTAFPGATPITTDLPGTVATSPGADSDGMAMQDGPVPLPDPTLDGQGAGEVDPFHIPDFLRRYPVATQV